MGLHSNLRTSRNKAKDAFCEFGGGAAFIFTYIAAFLRPAPSHSSALSPMSCMKRFVCWFVGFPALPGDRKAV